PEYLRYYFAAKLSSSIEDIDLNFNDFLQRVNSDLVGKVVNIASRCAGFIHKNYADTLSENILNPELFNDFVNAGDKIAQCYQQREYSHTVRLIMALADRANQTIDANKPWVLVKEKGKEQLVHDVCSFGINLFRVLIIYLKPILPQMAQAVEAFLNVSPMDWASREKPLLNHTINRFKPLLQRIDSKQIEALKEAAMHEIKNTASEKSENSILKDFPIAETIEITDFQKIDLRIAKIIEAEYLEGADKLLKLIVDIGGETRQIFAGIRSAYTPEQLIDRHTVVIANLKPRKMRFGVSEAMVLAAGAGDKELWILSPDDGAQAGMPVK
ncbi:MAG: methionine--tRNA ligase subunit beta, partial [Gammaproteobacteria bacterium]